MIPIIKATPKMAATVHCLSPNLLPQTTKFQTFASSLTPTRFVKPSCRTLKISCSKEEENLSDEMLVAELGLEIKKLNTKNVQREEALKKSRELLFAEMCDFMGLKSDDLKKKWRRMNEEERGVLAKGFVGAWSAQFHPLSARSVKEMVDEYLGQSNDFSGNFFPELGKFLGFHQNSEE